MILPLLLTPALLLLTPQNPGATPAPGTALLAGGRTTIGSSVKEIEKLVKDSPEAKTLVRALDGETPQFQESVAPFAIGVTEVTQEQFAAFVRTTGYRPPQDWGASAIEEGRRQFFEKLKAMRDAGESVVGLKYDADAWWEENWEGAEWAIPEGDALRPVVSIDYQDAMAYCRWAGVRLPSEYEFQHAVRGKSKDPYPWGDDWEDGKYAATSELPRVSRSYPVGSFNEGASGDGIHDLAGNVWEWTGSPYKALPGFEKNEYKVPGQRTKVTVPVPKWDGNQRVVVGGSYQNSRMAARCTVRRGADRSQRTNALGFRIASTPTPARDSVEHVWQRQLRGAEARPSGVTYELDAVLGQDLWHQEQGTGGPEGYAIITGYEHLALVPRSQMEETQDVSWAKASLVEPQHIGFLSLSAPALEPALPAGAYMIAFRAAGETREDREDRADDEEEDEETKKSSKDEGDPWAEVLDIEVANILLIDAATGEVVAAQPIEGVVFGKSKGEAGFTEVEKSKMVDDPAKPGKQVEITEKWLRIRGEVSTRIRRHVLPFHVDLRMDDEYWGKPWRQ